LISSTLIPAKSIHGIDEEYNLEKSNQSIKKNFVLYDHTGIAGVCLIVEEPPIAKELNKIEGWD